MCVFCDILAGKIPSKIFYRDDKMAIIADIDPKARLHYLAMPLRHFANVSEATEDDLATIAHILKVIEEKKDELGLSDGYRLVCNRGESAGQSVLHLHIHVLGGQPLGWPDLRDA